MLFYPEMVILSYIDVEKLNITSQIAPNSHRGEQKVIFLINVLHKKYAFNNQIKSIFNDN